MNNKGINLIALIILIIVMIILSGIAINNSTDSYNKSLEAKAREEKMQVTNAVNSRFGEYNVNPAINPLVGQPIPKDYLVYNDGELDVDTVKSYLIQKFRAEGKLQAGDSSYEGSLINQIDKFIRDNANEMNYTRILYHDDVVALELETISLESEFLVNYYSTDVVGPLQ